MKLKVMYYSRGGSTKKVAEAIANAVGEVAEAIPPAYPLENVGVLFLGAAPYMGKIDKKMLKFVKTLDSKRTKNVALFGTTGGQDSALVEMRGILKAQGINVLEDTFLCKGKVFGFINRKHPTNEELKSAEAFAKQILEKIKGGN